MIIDRDSDPGAWADALRFPPFVGNAPAAVYRVEGNTAEPGVIVWATARQAQVRWAGEYHSRLPIEALRLGRTDDVGVGVVPAPTFTGEAA